MSGKLEILFSVVAAIATFITYPLIPPVVMSLPLIGVVVSQSFVWNCIWWSLWFLWCLFWIRDTPRSVLGLLVAIVLMVIYLEAAPSNPFWFYSLTAASSVLVIGTYVLYGLPNKRIKKWLARDGTLGGTVRVLYRNYLRLISEQPTATDSELVQMLLEHRFHHLSRVNEESFRIQGILASEGPLVNLRDVCFAVATIEAGRPPDMESEELMREVINEELTRLGYDP